MADPNDRLTNNVAGRYYVDSSCVDCDQCRSHAPAFFQRDEETGFSFVFRQPASDEEVAVVEEALDGCPTESIGSDGSP
ncbi:ferredoxin [Nibricoccus aquaticus]|uniref:Ferredoxin n=1 Tax=Nibricoccus aquaticus TaxID=2576891 RepID=A0A290QGW3_9BACT|nr:ferredoxin [Nibricoccus aquaticus]ATC63122.1 ferredoxin [Nibricoccus aquaticus]